jgi:tetratricopeptide (TPR) repeat protein
MNNISELHNQAMKLSQRAMVARHNGEQARAQALSHEAFEYESQAAALIPDEKASEPTRSVIYCSAASLAYECQEWKAAKELINKALSGDPSERIYHALKTLSYQVDFESYLQTQKISLENTELNLFLQGKAVTSGAVIYEELNKRLTPLNVLIEKTIQRLSGIDYQKTGNRLNDNPFMPALSLSNTHTDKNHFSITLKLVSTGENPLTQEISSVIDNILIGMNLINEFKEIDLKEQIKTPGYYQNFLALTHDIAPDGEQIHFVGLSSSKKTVSLTRLSTEIELDFTEQSDDFAMKRQPIKIEGVLNYADSIKPKLVGLITQDSSHYKIKVEEGLDDYIKFYFGRWVTVQGDFDGHFIYLKDLQAMRSQRLTVNPAF